MPHRFGTDGIRGLANLELSPELVLSIGAAAARVLGGAAFLVGRDTRESGPMLAAALSAGVASQGVDVIDLGVITTPGVAYLAAGRGLPAAMISASHNAFFDNGVKLLSAKGSKLDDYIESAIEAELDTILLEGRVARDVSVGSIFPDDEGWREYANHLCRLSDVSLRRGLRVVCDCANGAASTIAPYVLENLEIDHVIVHASPDGRNINEQCGSTHPDSLQRVVLAERADVGLSFDGDADRLIAVDERGEIVDGDQLLALFAFDLLARDELAERGIAITVMSNLGLRLALQGAEIEIIETSVGDRYVLDAIESRSLVLGGEQSGHIIFRKHATTGDGILSALRLLELLSKTTEPLSELEARAMTRLPQELESVRVRDRSELEGALLLWQEIEEVSASLGGSGRVLVRASGTEDVVRVMVEAESRDVARASLERLVGAVKRELGQPEG